MAKEELDLEAKTPITDEYLSQENSTKKIAKRIRYFERVISYRLKQGGTANGKKKQLYDFLIENGQPELALKSGH